MRRVNSEYWWSRAEQAVGLLCIGLAFGGVALIGVDPPAAIACGVLSIAFNRIL